MCFWCDLFTLSVSPGGRLQKDTKYQVWSQILNCMPICITHYGFFSWYEVLSSFGGVEFLCVMLLVSAKLCSERMYWIYIHIHPKAFLNSLSEMKWYSSRASWGKKNHDINCWLLYLFRGNLECDMCTNLAWEEFHFFFASYRFDYDKLLLAYGIKKGFFISAFLLNSQEWLLKEMDSDANRGLRIGGAHNSPMEEAVLESSFSNLTLNPQLKCVTKLVWIGTSAGEMTRW